MCGCTSGMNGTIFDIKRFAIHDGPGIRTTVFLKGCLLRCLWCHNPESQKIEHEILFIPDKCIGCGWCFKNCPKHAHKMEDGKHVLHREECIRCGVCAEKCYAGAIEVIGREATVGQVIEEVLMDKPFYDNSGGGMTVSGGEPMFQPEFTAALLSEAKKHGLHTCLDTCGFAAWKYYAAVMDNVDLFLFDLKETDPEKHQETTGVLLEPILETLKRLDDAGKQIYLRCPLIPGFNDRDEHIKKIAEIAISLKNLLEIDLISYHPLGQAKLEHIGMKDKLGISKFANREQTEKFYAKLEKLTNIQVKIN